MPRLNFVLHDRHEQVLRSLSERTGESMSEWLRKMIDYGARRDRLNDMVPALSGSIQVRGGR